MLKNYWALRKLPGRYALIEDISASFWSINGTSWWEPDTSRIQLSGCCFLIFVVKLGKICNLVVTYEQNIESLMLQEEVHFVMWEQWFAELVWFLKKRWKRESCIVKHESICFSLERCGMRIHVSFRVAFLEWLDEICIALWFRLFPCFETLCFSW